MILAAQFDDGAAHQLERRFRVLHLRLANGHCSIRSCNLQIALRSAGPRRRPATLPPPCPASGCALMTRLRARRAGGLWAFCRPCTPKQRRNRDRRRTRIHGGPLGARVRPLVLGLYDPHPEPWIADRATHASPLAHHRRQRAAGRGEGTRRRRRTADPRPGRKLLLHVGLPVADGLGHHGRLLPVRGREGEAFDVAIPAFSLDSPQARRVIN